MVGIAESIFSIGRASRIVSPAAIPIIPISVEAWRLFILEQLVLFAAMAYGLRGVRDAGFEPATFLRVKSVAPEAARWSPTWATRSASPSESGVAVTDCYRHSSVTSKSAVARYGVLGQSGQAAPAQARSLGSGHPATGDRGGPRAGVAAVTRIVSAKLQVPSLGTAAG